MEAKELRAGISIVGYNNCIGIVSGIEPPYPRKDKRTDGKWLVELSLSGLITALLEELSPVPLDEDWLLKFGFYIRNKNYSLNYGGESMRMAILEKPQFVLWSHSGFGFNTSEGRRHGDYCIQHVHQLQNLYQALTGQELTLVTP